jgi:MoaA/NifB/PqqE/SkfB family radical SAM enzyme
MNKNSFFNRYRGVNIDITNRCSLECSKCRREYGFKQYGLKIPGGDISIENFKKVLKFFFDINFEGSLSDPVHHRSFIELLKMSAVANIGKVKINNASSAKSKEWYIEAFKSNPKANWYFSIDGLPEQSNIYRINQDGIKLFDIMIESKKYLIHKPVWQYVVFSYNENNIDTAVALAKEIEVDFYLLKSSRWKGNNDWLMPINPEYRLSPK